MAAQPGQKLYGGVEGGASHTKFVLVDATGKTLSSSEGKGTNQYLIGIAECLKIINGLYVDCLKAAGLPQDTVLDGLGLSLSGGEDSKVQQDFKASISADFPGLGSHLFVGCDTDAALAVAFPKGGVVMIAGTGSNCELINPDGTKARCGGWGHMIGDEASATWIALRAIKTFFDHEDGFESCPHSIEEVRQTVFRYFQIESRMGLLPYLYSDFNKAKLGGLCKELAQVCLEKKDPLCQSLFRQAGVMLARHLGGVSSKIHESLKTCKGGVPVLCQGSVFKSWSLMEKGFVDEMTSRAAQSGVTEVTLHQLQVQAGLGAAALGARAAGTELPYDYGSHTQEVFHARFTQQAQS